ncbi:hypothetical protein [Klebsiella pneumoniae IS46]|nr:hypothetical protein [Klebsiella pneumoniae IS46]
MLFTSFRLNPTDAFLRLKLKIPFSIIIDEFSSIVRNHNL